jgi:hypothetical protein
MIPALKNPTLQKLFLVFLGLFTVSAALAAIAYRTPSAPSMTPAPEASRRFTPPEEPVYQEPAPVAASEEEQGVVVSQVSFGRYLETSTFNLITNPSFEHNNTGAPQYWTYVGDSNVANTFVSQDTAYHGANSLKFNPTGGMYGVQSSTIVPQKDKTYTFSVWVRNWNVPSATVRVGILGGDGEAIVTDQPSDLSVVGYGSQYIDYSISGQTGWKMASFTYKFGPSASPQNFYVAILNGASGVLYVDAVQLEEGEVVSQFAPTGFSTHGTVSTDALGNLWPTTDREGDLGKNDYRWNKLHVGDISFAGRWYGDLIPGDDDKYSIGSSDAQWKDLWVDGTANIDILVLSTEAGEGVGSHLIPTQADFFTLGSAAYEWKAL